MLPLVGLFTRSSCLLSKVLFPSRYSHPHPLFCMLYLLYCLKIYCSSLCSRTSISLLMLFPTRT
ncbi:uncharacterized protein BT62DRAFT_468952 [Guyanagaster necrorhizus]|uniref:Uncharacterized protein n=1 Tax=Guyanagaster necrorhizus TaxID=856835 RepID=A0A9P8ANE8_9AGAR|nr:uncharacterized protein BT62DRAFT_468952 [Guyanagaster necrorhizus MCA 3950]KAG7441666.1 hypothetical protein BT62DRAFT_468952 [Guyanagaster necrorhizus MCA 3950]